MKYSPLFAAAMLICIAGGPIGRAYFSMSFMPTWEATKPRRW
jgi:hypothetical protein